MLAARSKLSSVYLAVQENHIEHCFERGMREKDPTLRYDILIHGFDIVLLKAWFGTNTSIRSSSEFERMGYH
jgi:hypothetical protein